MIPIHCRTWRATKFMGFVVLAAVSGVTGFAQIPQRLLKVSRVSRSTDLSSAEIDRILTDVSAIFTKADITPSCRVDIACPVTVSLQNLSNVPRRSFIQEAKELIDLHRETGSDVLVVDYLGDAACPDGIRGPGRILGCVGLANDWMAVLRYSAVAFPGIIWAHEFSHLRGNGHRDDPCALMNSYYTDANRTVNLKECTAVRGTPPPASSPALPPK